MPSIRTDWWHSTRLSSYSPMPSYLALRQGSYPSSSSSVTSTSVFRELPPCRWQEQIPNISLSEYGRIPGNDEDYDDLMTYYFDNLIKLLLCDTYGLQHNNWEEKQIDNKLKQDNCLWRWKGWDYNKYCDHTNRHPLQSPSYQKHNHPLHIILHQTRSWDIKDLLNNPLPPTNVTTTRGTRKPDHHCSDEEEDRWDDNF